MRNSRLVCLVTLVGCLAGCASKPQAVHEPGFVAEAVTMPQWSGDGQYLYYQQDASLVRYNVKTGERRVSPVPDGLKTLDRLMGPGVIVSPDGRWAACWTEGPARALGNMYLITVYVADLQTGATRVAYRTYGYYQGLDWLPPDRLLLSFAQDSTEAEAAKRRSPGSHGTGTVLIRPAGGPPRWFPGWSNVEITASDGSGFLHTRGKDHRLCFYDIRSGTDTCVERGNRFSERADRVAYLSHDWLIYVYDRPHGEVMLVDWHRNIARKFRLPHPIDDEMRVSPHLRRYWSWNGGRSLSFSNIPSRLSVYELPKDLETALRDSSRNDVGPRRKIMARPPRS